MKGSALNEHKEVLLNWIVSYLNLYKQYVPGQPLSLW